jgi:16S rRNA (uracil1498-N3)-methyltransferase
MLAAMSHIHRFYIPPGTVAEDDMALPPNEAHHALHVVRVRKGDAVGLFDGCGREIEGVVVGTARREVYVRSVSEQHVPRPRVELTLVQGWLHTDKAIEHLVRRGTELGVLHFRFFRAERSDRAPALSERWRRYAIASCKQCGRAWLPSFGVAGDLAEALAEVGGSLAVLTNRLDAMPLDRVGPGERPTLIVGPEGDLTDGELGLAQARGAAPVSLGSATYRSEVAAELAAALVLYEAGELGPRGR